MQLLSLGSSNAKLIKSDAYSTSYLSAIMYLAPHKTVGVGNLCPEASKGCAAACLYTAGRGAYSSVQKARMRRALSFLNERDKFLETLKGEIEQFIRKCVRNGKNPAIRLNGTSDIQWENFGIIEEFPNVQFYDYTKITRRMMKYCRKELPSNYHLTYSRSENNEAKCIEVLRAGGNVAAVFNERPSKYRRFRLTDGDKHDLRFIDESPRWVALTAKGKARKDISGFVIHHN